MYFQNLLCVFAHFVMPTLVSGDANFAMEYTALTIGGFTQPPIAHSIIEMSGNVDKGLCQHFLWIQSLPNLTPWHPYLHL